MAVTSSASTVAIIGGGPAGLMAAEVLSQAGYAVTVYDRMPSVGRKFLLAGVGGMNITHAEPAPAFVSRYREQASWAEGWLATFGAEPLRAWIHGLGIDTFVGSSGRVFPADMKAAPLLRAWLKRLRDAGVVIHTRHQWQGWDESGGLLITHEGQQIVVRPSATVLALGGGSWPRLGSDGAWLPWLSARGVATRTLQAANCGFETQGWSALLKERFAGAPLKNITLQLAGEAPRVGECVVTETGVEGSLVYALSAPIREAIDRQGYCDVFLDLLPARSLAQVEAALSKPRGARSMARHLQGQLRLDGVKAALLRECSEAAVYQDLPRLAKTIKALPLKLLRPRPLAEAISSAGGVCRSALDDGLMLQALPGVFCAGEMLDWEAPTGGYLLTACFASGRRAAEGVLTYLANHRHLP
ncbi:MULTISPECIES: TIGR03862 family flavoprotein [Pseudomonas]|uniref:TIGR03862 family flavoprotein n=1 Tax=Pseudomonas quercus TaxID=2722792 RepID=A0ABX0YGN3_9PSED|nr:MULTISPECIES: TIGR03862 family flavoprotein [Pseudomonas]MBF7143947.1 TIGR03862 family flavoprotein [Pseudomonas sp. LY10J]NJP02487.1 TIGR03862 family flavoprotein [Pseudomonas quercus]